MSSFFLDILLPLRHIFIRVEYLGISHINEGEGGRRMDTVQNLMQGNLDYNVIIAYIFGIALIYLIGRLMLMPIKFMIKLIYNGLMGGAMLWAVNFLGAYVNFGIAINPVTALVAGFLGVPGVVLLVVMKSMMG
jgi:inhibitor of the pro-sigma K processing machinery